LLLVCTVLQVLEKACDRYCDEVAFGAGGQLALSPPFPLSVLYFSPFSKQVLEKACDRYCDEVAFGAGGQLAVGVALGRAAYERIRRRIARVIADEFPKNVRLVSFFSLVSFFH
jgi:hypothetical protein